MWKQQLAFVLILITIDGFREAAKPPPNPEKLEILKICMGIFAGNDPVKSTADLTLVFEKLELQRDKVADFVQAMTAVSQASVPEPNVAQRRDISIKMRNALREFVAFIRSFAGLENNENDRDVQYDRDDPVLAEFNRLNLKIKRAMRSVIQEPKLISAFLESQVMPLARLLYISAEASRISTFAKASREEFRLSLRHECKEDMAHCLRILINLADGRRIF
jgi:hypothetical protein